MIEPEQNDHDMLVCIRVKLDNLQKGFDNHLSHHFRYNIMAWGVALAAIVGFILK